MDIPRNKRGRWLDPDRKPSPSLKTIKVICVACSQHYYLTLVALPWEFKKELEKTACLRCKTIGKLATSELAKTKPKVTATSQLPLNFDKKR